MNLYYHPPSFSVRGRLLAERLPGDEVHHRHRGRRRRLGRLPGLRMRQGPVTNDVS